MPLIVQFTAGADHRCASELEALVRSALLNHPFLSITVKLPAHLQVNVAICREQSTAIRFDTYPTHGDVTLTIFEFHLFKIKDGGSVIALDDAPLDDRLINLLFHEFGHFIDARLDASFGYKDSLHPDDPRVKGFVDDLWNASIDGRLKDKAPHTLAERQSDAQEEGGIPADAIARAWEGEWRTYPDLVRVAESLRSTNDQ